MFIISNNTLFIQRLIEKKNFFVSPLRVIFISGVIEYLCFHKFFLYNIEIPFFSIFRFKLRSIRRAGTIAQRLIKRRLGRVSRKLRRSVVFKHYFINTKVMIKRIASIRFRRHRRRFFGRFKYKRLRKIRYLCASRFDIDKYILLNLRRVRRIKPKKYVVSSYCLIANMFYRLNLSWKSDSYASLIGFFFRRLRWCLFKFWRRLFKRKTYRRRRYIRRFYKLRRFKRKVYKKRFFVLRDFYRKTQFFLMYSGLRNMSRYYQQISEPLRSNFHIFLSFTIRRLLKYHRGRLFKYFMRFRIDTRIFVRNHKRLFFSSMGSFTNFRLRRLTALCFHKKNRLFTKQFVTKKIIISARRRNFFFTVCNEMGKTVFMFWLGRAGIFGKRAKRGKLLEPKFFSSLKSHLFKNVFQKPSNFGFYSILFHTKLHRRRIRFTFFRILRFFFRQLYRFRYANSLKHRRHFRIRKYLVKFFRGALRRRRFVKFLILIVSKLKLILLKARLNLKKISFSFNRFNFFLFNYFCFMIFRKKFTFKLLLVKSIIKLLRRFSRWPGRIGFKYGNFKFRGGRRSRFRIKKVLYFLLRKRVRAYRSKKALRFPLLRFVRISYSLPIAHGNGLKTKCVRRL